jgi:hypothetical protein
MRRNRSKVWDKEKVREGEEILGHVGFIVNGITCNALRKILRIEIL